MSYSRQEAQAQRSKSYQDFSPRPRQGVLPKKPPSPLIAVSYVPHLGPFVTVRCNAPVTVENNQVELNQETKPKMSIPSPKQQIQEIRTGTEKFKDIKKISNQDLTPRIHHDVYPRKPISKTPFSPSPEVDHKPKKLNIAKQPQETHHQTNYSRQEALAQTSISSQVFASRPHQDMAPRNSSSQPPSYPSQAANYFSHPGPFVTQVSLNMPATMENNQVELSQERKPEKSKSDPEQQLQEIRIETETLKEDIEKFTGCVKDKNYEYLQKRLDRLRLKHDEVITGGKSDIRRQRRQTFMAILGCISLLEQRISTNTEEQAQINTEKQVPSNPEIKLDPKIQAENVLCEMERNFVSQPLSSPSPEANNISHPGWLSELVRSTEKSKQDRRNEEVESNDSIEPNEIVKAKEMKEGDCDKQLTAHDKRSIVDDLLSELCELSDQVKEVAIADFNHRRKALLRKIWYCKEKLLVLRKEHIPSDDARPFDSNKETQLQSNVSDPAFCQDKQLSDCEEELDDEISDVLAEIEGIKRQVESFTGVCDNRQYKYLEKRLHMCLGRLDEVDTSSGDEIRERRRITAKEISSVLNLLKGKVFQ